MRSDLNLFVLAWRVYKCEQRLIGNWDNWQEGTEKFENTQNNKVTGNDFA